MSERPLTKAQRWALEMIKRYPDMQPQYLGVKMMDRPGAMPAHRTHAYKAQGYGRMGGAMMSRLEKKGLIISSMGTGRNWHPAQARITAKGLKVLEQPS